MAFRLQASCLQSFSLKLKTLRSCHNTSHISKHWNTYIQPFTTPTHLTPTINEISVDKISADIMAAEKLYANKMSAHEGSVDISTQMKVFLP
jgi:hypothetical protein